MSQVQGLKLCANCTQPVLSVSTEEQVEESRTGSQQGQVDHESPENFIYNGREPSSPEDFDMLDLRSSNTDDLKNSTGDVENPANDLRNHTDDPGIPIDDVETPTDVLENPTYGLKNPTDDLKNSTDHLKETDTDDDDLSKKKLTPEDLASYLQSIYSLKYLHYFSDDPIFESAPALCSRCEHVLYNLQKFYEQFNSLRSIESDLAKKISQLDGILESQWQSNENCDGLTEQGDSNLPDVLLSESDTEYPIEPEESTGREIVNPFGPGPWVLLERLNLPEGQITARICTTNTTEEKPRPKMRTKRKKVIIEEEEEPDQVLIPGDLTDNEVIMLSGDDGHDSDYEASRKRRKSSRVKTCPKSDQYSMIVKPLAEEKPRTKTKETKASKKESGVFKKESGASKKASGASKKASGVSNKASKVRSAKTSPLSKTSSKSKKRRRKGQVRLTEPKKPRFVALRVDKRYPKRKRKHTYPCWHCEKNFEDREEIKEHAEAQHLRPHWYFCEDCFRVCKTENGFEHHKQQCANWKPGEKLERFTCPLCPKTFLSKTYQKYHIKLHDDERPFPCTKCSYRAKSKIVLVKHMGNMHDENRRDEPAQCGQCGSWHKNEQGLKLHVFYHHTEEGNEKYRQSQRACKEKLREKRRLNKVTKTYVCTECNVDFFSSLRLLCHQKTVHQRQTHFVCEQCGKDFTTGHSLRHHINYVHSDERAFMCEHCGKAFKTNYNLKDHVDHTHTEEGRLKYNAKMRIHNQRRKLVAQALARKQEAERLGLPPPPPPQIPEPPQVPVQETNNILAPSDHPVPPIPEPFNWQAAAAAAGLVLPLPFSQQESLLNLTLPQIPSALPVPVDYDAGSSTQSSV